MTNFGFFLIYLITINYIHLQKIPQNPCPDIFKYVVTNNYLHGRVEFQNDYSGVYFLIVNMSVASFIGNGQNIKLELQTPSNDLIRGAPLAYNIYFPTPYAIPKPTRIEFNSKLYCSSPAEQVHPGGYVTNLWANSFFKVTITMGPNVNSPFPLEDFQKHMASNSTQLQLHNPLFGIEHTEEKLSTMCTISELVTKPSIVTPTPIDFNECGKPSIITVHSTNNEDNIEDGQYPWLAAIMFKAGTQYEYRCTGTLVTTRHVITAGHCLQYGKASLFPVEDLIVVLGVANLKNWILTGTMKGVSEISTHPNYIEDSADNDVSVITLNSHVEFNKNIRHICMWGNQNSNLEDIVGKEGTVAGWIADKSHVDYIQNAKRTFMPVVTQNTCLQSDLRFKSIISKRTFCAGKRNKMGPCMGDSGAGFALRKNGQWFLRGIISIQIYDSGSCNLENYFVFADLAQVKGWLSTILQ